MRWTDYAATLPRDKYCRLIFAIMSSLRAVRLAAEIAN